MIYTPGSLLVFDPVSGSHHQGLIESSLFFWKFDSTLAGLRFIQAVTGLYQNGGHASKNHMTGELLVNNVDSVGLGQFAVWPQAEWPRAVGSSTKSPNRDMKTKLFCNLGAEWEVEPRECRLGTPPNIQQYVFLSTVCQQFPKTHQTDKFVLSLVQ